MPFDEAESDAALVGRIRTGHSAAFERLVRRHYRAAHAVAFAVLGNRADAQDACQEAFLKVVRSIDDCRDPSRFAAWCLTITRNVARNARDARRVRAADSIDDVAVPATDDPARAAERAELASRLEEALAVLTERQREVVLLHDRDGLSHPEIARSLGISEVSSRQYLFVARQKLRETLGSITIAEHVRDR
jgi:RNA polymerase sigma-70 factor (ECF subfamily)